MERTKRKSSVYNDYVPYGGRVPNFKEKEGMKLKKEQFDVTGMTCSACSARIEKSVSKLPGIKEVSVNLLKNSMVASYDESILDTSGIIQAVEKAGYGAIPKTLAQSGSKPAVAAGKPEISTAQKDYKQIETTPAFICCFYDTFVLYINGAYDGVATACISSWNGKCNELCFYAIPAFNSCSICEF